MAKRIRIERKTKGPRDDRSPVLPIDPRDSDVLRAKQIGQRTAGR